MLIRKMCFSPRFFFCSIYQVTTYVGLTNQQNKELQLLESRTRRLFARLQHGELLTKPHCQRERL